MSTIEYLEDLDSDERVLSQHALERILKEHNCEEEYTGPMDVLELFYWLGY